MRKDALTLVVFSIFLVLRVALLAQERISPAEAAKYIGRRATVCGLVASANYATQSQGQPTYLDLDSPYPNHIFTALIWGENRDKFSTAPEKAYSGKRICVKGILSNSRGQPQIFVTSPSQITAE